MWYIIRESSIIGLNIDRAISSAVLKFLHIPMRWHYDIMSPSNEPVWDANITPYFLFPVMATWAVFSCVFSMVGSYTVNIVGGVVQRLPSTGNNKDHDPGPQVGTVSIYTYNLTEKNHAELITHFTLWERESRTNKSKSTYVFVLCTPMDSFGCQCMERATHIHIVQTPVPRERQIHPPPLKLLSDLNPKLGLVIWPRTSCWQIFNLNIVFSEYGSNILFSHF